MILTDEKWEQIKKKCPEVKVCNLHKAIHAAGALATDTTLYANNTRTKGIKMWWGAPDGFAEGLYYEIKGVRGSIPAANISNNVFMDASVEVAQTKAV